MFQYKRVTQFYETDAMGIIHHANYVYLMEEARLSFVRQIPGSGNNPLGPINYPLLSCEVQYKKPLYFNDNVIVDFEVEAKAARLIFQYQIRTERSEHPVAFGKTVHAAYDMKAQRATKIPQAVIDFLAQRRK